MTNYLDEDILEKNLSKSNNSKKCMIYDYQLSNHGFDFQDYVCNSCHDLTKLSVNINDIPIINVKNGDYHCIIESITKSEEVNLLKTLFLKIMCIYKIYCLKFQ